MTEMNTESVDGSLKVLFQQNVEPTFLFILVPSNQTWQWEIPELNRVFFFNSSEIFQNQMVDFPAAFDDTGGYTI